MPWLVALGAASCGRLDFHESGDGGGGGRGDAGAIDASPRVCAADTDCELCERCANDVCAKEPVGDLALGHRSTCFLGDQDSRWCIGEDAGEGIPTNVPPFYPRRIAGDDGWSALVLGYTVNFGLHGGDVYQWSDDNAPALDLAGPPPTTYSADTFHWCAVDNTTGVAACDGQSLSGSWLNFAAGNGIFCGVRSDHTLWCYGTSFDNCLGQPLTDGTVVAAPVQVGAATDWSSATVGDVFGCAMKTDHTIWCWGDNAYTGTGFADSGGVPAQIAPDTDWTSLTSRWHHTCAMKSSGDVLCWGGDDYGLQVVDSAGADVNVGVPTAVATGIGFAQFWMGGHHYCGVEASTSTIRCWGWNAAAQLVNGDTATRDTFATSLPICTQAP